MLRHNYNEQSNSNIEYLKNVKSVRDLTAVWMQNPIENLRLLKNTAKHFFDDRTHFPCSDTLKKMRESLIESRYFIEGTLNKDQKVLSHNVNVLWHLSILQAHTRGSFESFDTLNVIEDKVNQKALSENTLSEDNQNLLEKIHSKRALISTHLYKITRKDEFAQQAYIDAEHLDEKFVKLIKRRLKDIDDRLNQNLRDAQPF